MGTNTLYLKKIDDTPVIDTESNPDQDELSVSFTDWLKFSFLIKFFAVFIGVMILIMVTVFFGPPIIPRTRDVCVTELESLKHQLEVETDYKDRVEKLLADAQKYHEADKERFKYLMQSCFAITQQSVFWKYQFEALQQDTTTAQKSH